MSVIEILVGVVVVAAFGTGVGLTLGADSGSEFWWAKACYIIAALALAGAYFYWLYEADRSPFWRVIIGVVVGVLAIAATPELIRWVDGRQAKFEALAAKEQQPPESPEQQPQLRLAIECTMGFMPEYVPASGRYYMLSVYPTPIANGGGGLPQYFGEPGAKLTWPPKPDTPPGMRQEAYECSITNYGTDPVFNVELSLRLIFNEVIKDPTQPGVRRSGPAALDRQWPITIPTIDPGRENAFSFIAYNISDKFATVVLPNSASLNRFGSTYRITTVLQISGASQFFIAP